MKALEFFAGIGGFAHATSGRIEIERGYEISPHCVEVYRRNFDHTIQQVDLLSTSVELPEADFWWMSPPCTPFTRRGPQRDLADHRAEPFVCMMDRVTAHKPKIVAIENVEGFVDSEAHALWKETTASYHVVEKVICPTDFEIPNKRPRYYSVACSESSAVPDLDSLTARTFSLDALLQMEPGALIKERLLEKYGRVMHRVDVDSEYTTCFTGGYGKSWVYAGSFVDAPDGVRLFSPQQIGFALGFPEIEWGVDISNRQRLKYLGNSLSVFVVEAIVSAILTKQ